MTTRGNVSRVGDVLPQVLSHLKLDNPLQAYRAVEVWPETVGERIAGHVRAVSVKRDVLLVETDSSVWMQEIQFHKRRILELLTERCGAGTIREIKCVLGNGEREV